MGNQIKVPPVPPWCHLFWRGGTDNEPLWNNGFWGYWCHLSTFFLKKSSRGKTLLGGFIAPVEKFFRFEVEGGTRKSKIPYFSKAKRRCHLSNEVAPFGGLRWN